MDKRIEIALVYINSKNWIGGTYYVENLVSALNTLDDKRKPFINLYCNGIDNYIRFKKVTNYPYLQFHNHSDNKPIIYKIINRIRYSLSPLNYKALGALDLRNTNNVIVFPVRFRTMVQPDSMSLAWIPDFQEKHLPHLFSKSQIRLRENVHRSFINKGIPIVFSSNDSQNDFYTYYPDAKDVVKTFVLPFAVKHPVFDQNIEKLRIKYNIEKEYLFCANQFWVHKNHKFLFEAFAEAKKRGLKLQLVCTGNMYDNRNKEYSNELSTIIQKNNLDEDVKIVGFISREEQLCLMANSYAVVQPSLFEGWSTVVEDAKSLNKYIFLSNINVHKEQNPYNSCYFNPYDTEDLVVKLLSTTIEEKKYNYYTDVQKFANRFMSILYAIMYEKEE